MFSALCAVFFTILLTACPNAAGGSTGGGSNPAPQPVTKFKVSFGVEGGPANGTLAAEVDGNALTSPAQVEKGKTVVFTATPDNANILVKKWTVSPNTALTEGGTDGSLTAKVKVTADTTVKVSFEAAPVGTAVYTVEHWKQNIAGTDYEKAETETKRGAVGAQTEAQAKTYPGFTAKLPVTQQTIQADGSTVVRIDYDRKEITLTLNLGGGTTTTPLVDGNKLKGRFETPVPAVAEPAKPGYIFKGWNPVLPSAFPAENPAETYTAQWAKESDYTITYHLNGGTNNGGNPVSYNVETPTIILKSAVRAGYDFSAWYASSALTGTPVTKIEKGSTGNKELWAKWLPGTNTPYKVEHCKQDIAGTTYTPAETENKTGTTGAMTQAQAKNYPGFTAKAVTQVPIAADGSTVVKIEYDRKTITLTLSLNGGNMDPPIPGNKLTGRFGQALPPVTEPTRDGYGFMDWEPPLPASFPANDGTYTAEWQAYTDIPYTVEHWKQNIAGTDYEKAETETKTGSPDTPTQAQAKNYPGFTAQPVTQVPIAGNGSTVVKIKYDRKLITLTLNLAGGNMDPPIPGNKLTGRFGQAVPEVTAPTKTGYIFKGWNPPLPAAFPAHDGTHSAQWVTSYRVSWEAGNGGLIKVNSGDFAKRGSGDFEYGTRLTFTAKPDAGYKVQKWYLNSTATGISALTYEHTVTDYALVHVDFTEADYLRVPYANLDAYLANASSTEINCIEITDIPASAFTGALGNKIKAAPAKKVALKLPQSVSGLTEMPGCFKNCKNLLAVANIPEGVQGMSECFRGCSNLTEAPVIPVSVCVMSYCFADCSSLTVPPVIPVNANVTNMTKCFKGCTSLTQAPAIPVRVANMECCFENCYELTQPPYIPVTGGLISMRGCFKNCSKLTRAPVIPSRVTDMEECFRNCTSLTQAPAIPASVKDMSYCFYDCKNLTQAPVIPANANVTRMIKSFSGCKKLTQAPVIPSQVTSMSGCFQGCSSLTQAPVIPASVTDMANCFQWCSSLIRGPDIPANVIYMSSCFDGCDALTGVKLNCPYNNFSGLFSQCYTLQPGGIQVKTGHYGAYTAEAALNNMQVPGATVELKRAKFSTF